MELTNEFTVGVPVSEAWAVLTDVERIAPCMPGAELKEVAGEEYRGVVKVKVGPITAQYKGRATFVERDERGGRAVLRAEGRDTRGQGNANATITATLEPDGGSGTRVKVVTDLAVTGRVAQFGRGVLNDVSLKLLNQFVDCLESSILVDGPAAGSRPAASPPYDQEGAVTPDGPAPATAGRTAQTEPPGAVAGDEPVVRTIASPPAEPVDLLEAAGGSLAKRLAPVGVVVIVLWLLRRRRRRRRSGGRG